VVPAIVVAASCHRRATDALTGRAAACIPLDDGTAPMAGQFVELLSRAREFCNPAGVLPKLNVVTVNHSLGAFLRNFVIIAVEINRLNEVAISANQVSSIVRHS
jgi:hypothetical protein